MKAITAATNNLTAADLARMRSFRIPDDLVELHEIRRVTSDEARNDCGIQYRGDLGGVAWPITGADGSVKGFRIRRDNPEIENGKPKAKHVQGIDMPHLYFERSSRQWLSDTSVPVVFVEAYSSALAVAALSQRTGRDFLVVATAGCWGWRGTIGKTPNENGVRVDEKGPTPDLKHIALPGRKAIIVFDSNVDSNTSVQAAERGFKRELQRRGAHVGLARIPQEPGINGPDDYIAAHTDEDFLQILDGAGGADEDRDEVMRFTRMGDLLCEHEEETAWLVEGKLPMGGDSLLVAKPKVGKSTLARCLALAVARGEMFLGYPCAEGSVFYLALEEKRAEVRRHFRAMGARNDDPIFVFCASSPADGLAQLYDAMQTEKPVLVIVDPLFRFVRVKDGNDYAAVTNALEPLHILARKTGAHVMAVHHAGKMQREGGDAVLGSTALFGCVDTLLMMKRNDKCRTLSSIQRYGTDLDEITLLYDPNTRTLSAGPVRAEADQAEAAEAILEFLKTQSESVEERLILESVEGRRALLVKALRLYVKTGTIKRTGSGKKNDTYKYFPCSVVPNPLREQGNKQIKNDLIPSLESPIACSRPFPCSEQVVEPLEQAILSTEHEEFEI